MFNGDDRVSITTDMPEEEFHEKVQEALEALGDVEVDDGALTVSPKAALVSFMSTVAINGRVKSTDDGYKVEINYSVAPSGAMWALTILGLCVLFPIGAAVIILPMVIDKPTVQKAVESGLRDLKDEFAPKKKKTSSKSGE